MFWVVVATVAAVTLYLYLRPNALNQGAPPIVAISGTRGIVQEGTGRFRSRFAAAPNDCGTGFPIGRRHLLLVGDGKLAQFPR